MVYIREISLMFHAVLFFALFVDGEKMFILFLFRTFIVNPIVAGVHLNVTILKQISRRFV